MDTELMQAVGKYLGFTNGKYIKIVPIDTSNKLILGKLRHFNKGVDIGINDFALNTCWKRFVITKELSHLIMSRNGEGITENIEALINGQLSKCDARLSPKCPNGPAWANGNLIILKAMIKEYYNSKIVLTLFDYEFLK